MAQVRFGEVFGLRTERWTTTKFLRRPRDVFERILTGSTVIFITRRYRCGRTYIEGAIVNLDVERALTRYYRTKINPDWGEPITLSIGGFQRRTLMYEEDVSRNHVVRITFHGKLVGAWVSNSVLRDFTDIFPGQFGPDWPRSRELVVI